jgi:hypothetical protein
MNDLGRVEQAQRDRDYLVSELTAAFGLGGHGRLVHGSSERARTSVARSLRYAARHIWVVCRTCFERMGEPLACRHRMPLGAPFLYCR